MELNLTYATFQLKCNSGIVYVVESNFILNSCMVERYVKADPDRWVSNKALPKTHQEAIILVKTLCETHFKKV